MSSRIYSILRTQPLVNRTLLITSFGAFFALSLSIALHYLGLVAINTYPLTLYMIWITPFGAVAGLMCLYLTSNSQIFLSSILRNDLFYSIQLIIFAVAVLFLHLSLDHLTITLTVLLTFLCLITIALIFINKNILGMLISGLKSLKLKQPIKNTVWFSTSKKLLVNSTFFLLLNVLDLIIVRIVNKNGLGVGYYAAILTLIALIYLNPNILYRSIRPKYTHLLSSQKGRAELQMLLDNTNRAIVFLTCVLGFLFIYYSKTWLSFFGPDYVSATLEFNIMTIASCFVFIIGADALNIIIYGGDERLGLKINIITVIITLLVVTPATYFWGILGTAISVSIIRMTIIPISSVLIVRRKFKLRSGLLF